MEEAVDLLIEAFTLFPRNPNRINDIEQELEHHFLFKPMEFRHLFDGYGEHTSVCFYVEDIGKLSKDEVSDNGKPHYRLCFFPYNEQLEREEDDYLLVESSLNKYISSVAACVLKYMYSRGKDTSELALLVNDFPEFCSLMIGADVYEA